MAPELVERVLRDELGGAPGALLRRGTRYRSPPRRSARCTARTHDGRDVAVKVQYPGVDDAIRADLTTTDVLFTRSR